jgi:putative transposase
LELPIEQRCEMIEPLNDTLSVSKQCEMVNVQRSSYYNFVKEKAPADQAVKATISKAYAKRPSNGSRKITDILRRHGISINRKRTQRLMRELGIQGVRRKRKLSTPKREHHKYPYIARDKPITKINQVWSTDITYIITKYGVVYLVAIIDWHSRLILSWNMSNSMEETFCVQALEKALQRYGKPEIFNADQGSQFTGELFISTLLAHGIKPSHDGKGRATDNAQMERFWGSIKWEDLYLRDITSLAELRVRIEEYILYYNHERPHQSLNYKTPSEVHFNLEKKVFDSDSKLVYSEEELKHMAL